MNEPILYSFRRCPYAMRARLALLVSSMRCQLREVRLSAKPEAMLTASPKGTVPVLVLPDGTVAEQSLDIMRLALARRDPEGWLAREDAALIAVNDGAFSTATSIPSGTMPTRRGTARAGWSSWANWTPGWRGRRSWAGPRAGSPMPPSSRSSGNSPRSTGRGLPGWNWRTCARGWRPIWHHRCLPPSWRRSSRGRPRRIRCTFRHDRRAGMIGGGLRAGRPGISRPGNQADR